MTITAASPSIWFLAPSCFWTSTTSSVTWDLSNLILTGNPSGNGAATGPAATDPLLRFPSSTTSLKLTNVLLGVTEATVSTYQAQFSRFSSAYSSLKTLTMTSTPVGGASLFATVPSKMASFTVNKCGLAGSIPAGLFSVTSGNTAQSTLLTFSVANNALTGSIPSDLFVSWNGNTYMGLTFDVSGNQLSGTLPPLLSAFTTAISTVSLNFGDNQLSGDLPANFWPGRYFYSAFVNISHNAFSGDISAWGQVLFNYYPRQVTIDASYNALTGTPDFFTNVPAPPAVVYMFVLISVDLSNNQLSSLAPGVLPNATIASNTVNPTIFTMNLSNNSLAGSIPTNMVLSSVFPTTTINLADNQLDNGASGLKMIGFFDASSPAWRASSVALNVDGNLFKGPLDLSGITSSAVTTLTTNKIGFKFNASRNSFTAVGMDDAASAAISVLDISHNPKMTQGGFSDDLFNSSSILTTLYASDTALTGQFPDLGLLGITTLKNIDISDNRYIEFCGMRTAWTPSVTVCLLEHTYAINCPEQYPSSCLISAPAPLAAPVPEPVTAPVAEPVATPVASPVDEPTTAPATAPATPTVTPTAEPQAPSPVRAPTGAANASVSSLAVVILSVMIMVLAM